MILIICIRLNLIVMIRISTIRVDCLKYVTNAMFARKWNILLMLMAVREPGQVLFIRSALVIRKQSSAGYLLTENGVTVEFGWIMDAGWMNSSILIDKGLVVCSIRPFFCPFLRE